MSCGGCNSSAGVDDRSRAAMCETCTRAERGTGIQRRRTALNCSVSGLPVALHFAGAAPCPRGKFSDSDVYRWARLRWYGVPFPVRLWLRLFHWKHPKIGSFAGCGCIKPLKDLTARWLKH